MTWQQLNAECARRMHEYYILSAVNVGRGYRSMTLYVCGTTCTGREMGNTKPTRQAAFAEGMLAIRAATGVEAETGGWRE